MAGKGSSTRKIAPSGVRPGFLKRAVRSIASTAGLAENGDGKRDQWFNDYQEIPQLGVKGKRSLSERIPLFRQDDFRDASVLDVGCNRGQMCFQADDWGASHVVGVEYDHAAYLDAQKYNALLEKDVRFICDDIDNPFLWNMLPQFDVTLFLSVVDTKELSNRFGDLAKVAAKTKSVMYLEGHTGPNTDYQQYIKLASMYTDFKEIVYLGEVPDREASRSLIRCTRNYLNSEEAVAKIRSVSENCSRIAVVGKSCVGKSHIRQALQESGGVAGFEMIDDLKSIDRPGHRYRPHELSHMNSIVVFDYRALEYADNFDVVFLVAPKLESIDCKHREDMPDFRSPTGALENAKAIYTVISR